jgi:hypothetical protein
MRRLDWALILVTDAVLNCYEGRYRLRLPWPVVLRHVLRTHYAMWRHGR